MLEKSCIELSILGYVFGLAGEKAGLALQL